MRFLYLLFCICFLTSCENKDKHEEAVRHQSKKFEQALNAQDADGIVELWADEAVYRNPITGKLVEGKEAIKKEYVLIFDKTKGAKIETEIQSITFPFDDKATEEGVARLNFPGKPPVENNYTIIYVKKDGSWKILNFSKLDLGLLDDSSKNED